MARCRGLVLAGGRSSRMGRDKAALRWTAKSTFLDRAIDILDQAGCDAVDVSGDRPTYRGIRDEIPGRGPISGVHAWLAAHRAFEGLLCVVPVDMPRLTAGHLRQLMHAAQINGIGAYFNASPLPLVVRVKPGLRTAVNRIINEPDHSLRRLIKLLGLTPVATESDVLFNVNRPSELAAIRDPAHDD